MDIVKWVQDYVDGAYRQWATGTRQTMQDFADDMQPWLDELLENREGRDARREWAAFVGRWSARIRVNPTSYANFEDWLVQHVEHGCCEQCAGHGSEPAADDPLAEAGSPAAPSASADSDDSYFSDEERDSLQNEIATYFYEEQRKLRAQREAIIAILGPDWNNVSIEAVKTLRREGLIADENGGFVSPLTVTVGLPREDGGTDTLVLRFEWPWFSGGPHWEQERYLPATDPAKEGQRIAKQNDQRHQDVMRVRGATIQAQMGVYEMLMSGGGLIFILQGIDQFLTAGRSLASQEARESLITNAAASFYEHVLGMDPQEALEAGRRVDQLLPLIAGLGEAGLNTIRERFAQGQVGRGVWDEPPVQRGEIIEKQRGQNLPQTFPVVDKIDDGVVTSIKSMDLGSPTYVLDPDAITRTGKGYVDTLVAFEGGKRANVKIEPHQIRGKVLELDIPPKNTPAQTAALMKVVDYGASNGIKVDIVRIK